MADIVFKDVSKSFGGKVVLNKLSFTIKSEECFTILGPSGCGKTVILRLIAGFEAPDEGQIIIGGTTVADAGSGLCIPPEERKLGVVFQDYAVWPHKTVAQNISYPLEMQKLPLEERQDKVMRAVKLVNLDGLEHRFPYQLSGGQQQRVALARAVVSDSSVLLLDEPLTNLDANLREEMRFEIKNIQKKIKNTILYVTHDQEVALAISDRIAVMASNGAFCQIDTPERIFEHPVNLFVFRFLGVANHIACKIVNGKTVTAKAQKPFAELPEDKTLLRDRGECIAAFRPSDVSLAKSGSGFEGTVVRAAVLGSVIDYVVSFAEEEIRVQIQTSEAVKNGVLFKEGETAYMTFNTVLWFPKEEGKN
ncbi:MAG: ABC transporter ATP-binding protein [Treponema sp.]